jgi:hypothetical protein
LAPSPSRYRFEVDLPVDPLLTVGLGYLPSEKEGSRIGYRITVESDRDRSVVLDETLMVAPDGEWQDRAISLTEWSRQHPWSW